VFGQQPAGPLLVGALLSPYVTVRVEDANGNLVTSGGPTVTLSVASGPTGAALDGTMSVTARNGIATFKNIWFSDSGTYTLQASCGVLTAATSNSLAASGNTDMSNIASFATLVGGANPQGALVEDSSGNLYGVTTNGGAHGYGSIFEVARGSDSITTLTSFDNANGAFPEGRLLIDSAGNLYGTTSAGGANGDGTVFELQSGSHSVATLGTFNGSNGAAPAAGLIRDSAGDLFGATSSGGDANGDGTVFEIVNGSNTITTLVQFNGADGSGPLGEMVMDSQGNLYGTTTAGGANGNGTIFKIASGSLTTLASFNGTNGDSPQGALLRDSGGDLFGTTYDGGAFDDGTVFELASGSSTITTLVSFNGTNGANPISGVVMDNNGDLFGTTSSGGDANGDGTVFEIAQGTDTITTLALLNSGNGSGPNGLLIDSSGDLFGTTSNGGADGYGVVFELQI
jgi:uncharacterized repeat protein (TIGR03803 family)